MSNWRMLNCYISENKMSQYGLFRTIFLAHCLRNGSSTTLCQTSLSNRVQTCGYAKKVDPVRLTTYAVGANIFKQGEDPKLKEPEEYPEWLFQLNLGMPKKLNELEADTWEYWKRLRKENIWRHNKLHKGKKF
ncbi:39S ribosomal protein L54, mitochondrial [Boleophthalmus pectinirostris]|uniref:39S ribosomal protein L54, mitochondrial n=1 Tax=Boleophthalmus pectinirostris TaxID=150288 RepID=UPI002431A1A2|nr:39S ribosomal protein L54, mitochondrial [Boleophthalmus pectinirostris]